MVSLASRDMFETMTNVESVKPDELLRTSGVQVHLRKVLPVKVQACAG